MPVHGPELNVHPAVQVEMYKRVHHLFKDGVLEDCALNQWRFPECGMEKMGVQPDAQVAQLRLPKWCAQRDNLQWTHAPISNPPNHEPSVQPL